MTVPVALTALLGAPATDAGGASAGRLADVSVRLSEPLPRVTHVVLAAHGQRRMLPVGAVTRWDASGLVVADDGRTRSPESDVLLLARDVLDTQVVDVRGRRMARVGDVLLDRTPDGLRLTGVDTGLAAVVRRLGLGSLSRGRGRHELAWTDLHLASARGHRLQLRGEGAAVHALGAEDLAHLAARLPPHRADEVLERLPPDRRQAHEVAHRPRFRVMRARRHAPS
jgi:hypothetical protein